MNIRKSMRVKVLVPALLTAVFAVPVMANDHYTDTARVLSVTPQTDRVNMPRQECRTEYQQQSYSNAGDHSIAGAVIGGIAGGLLGSTIGHGNGRVAAAAVGAGVGAITGDRIDNQNSHGGTRMVPVQSCYQVDNWQTVNSGYLVTYEYNGRAYSTVTDKQPGRYIEVNVAVYEGNRPASQVGYFEPDHNIRSHGWGNEHSHHESEWHDERRDEDDRHREDQ